MQTYTVIWRADGDDFMVTVVDSKINSKHLSSLDWVLMAAEVEYAFWDESDKNDAIEYIKHHSYDLLGVFKGQVEWVA